MWKMKALTKVLLPMAFTVVLSAVTGIGVHAATSSEVAQALSEKLPVATYATPLSGASKVYASRGSGYIDTYVDVAVVTDVTSDGTEVYVTYPIGSGKYTSRWFKTEDIVGLSFVSVDRYNYTMTNQLTTYRMNGSNSTTTSGYIDKDDACVSLGSHEIGGANYYATIYPVSSSTVNGIRNVKNCLRLAKETVNNMEDVTRSFAGKNIVLKSVENGKYMSVQKNTNNAPVFCSANSADRRTGGTSWELFNVSVNSDGWAGLKASCNGKWFCARMDVTDNPVYTNANGFSTWEMLRFYKSGSDYYIKSYANNRWLTARVNVNNAPVAAYGTKASTWERFSIETVQDGLDQKINDFINDSRWKNGISWGNQTPKLSGAWSSKQCAAYVADFIKYVHGASSPYSGTKYTSVSEIRKGDVLYGTPMHWMCVLERNGDTVRIAEGNVGSPRQVRISYMTLKGNDLYASGGWYHKTFQYGFHF